VRVLKGPIRRALGSFQGHRRAKPNSPYLPAAFRKAAMILSCHPGPSSTSRGIRSETSSVAPGSAGAFGAGASGGLVVADLKAASAASRVPIGGRLLLGGLVMISLSREGG
jgi:hypothetical protein